MDIIDIMETKPIEIQAESFKAAAEDFLNTWLSNPQAKDWIDDFCHEPPSTTIQVSSNEEIRLIDVYAYPSGPWRASCVPSSRHEKIRTSTRENILYHLEQELAGNELLMKEVWEECDSYEEAQTARDELRKIIVCINSMS